MFLDKNDNKEQADDPFCENTASKKYYCKTRKVLKMRRIFSTPRTEFLDNNDDPQCNPNPEQVKAAGVPVKYQEEGTVQLLTNTKMSLFFTIVLKNVVNCFKKCFSSGKLERAAKS